LPITDENIQYIEIPYFRYIELNSIIIGVSCFIQTKKMSDNHFHATGFKNIDPFMFLNKFECDSYIEKLNKSIKNNNI
ncbi:hypothetical protein Q4R06_10840, partial [Morganella morganii subsp. sibonii]